MSKGLEALKNIELNHTRFGNGKDFDIIEKELKALDIIKNKGIDTETFFQFETYEEYVEYCENNEIYKNLYGNYTQEEYDLLKRCCYEINY